MGRGMLLQRNREVAMSNQHAGLVVVGVDGTAESDAALAFAVDEVARSGDSVEVVSRFCAHHAAVSVVVVPAAQPSHEHGTQALQRVGTSPAP